MSISKPSTQENISKVPNDIDINALKSFLTVYPSIEKLIEVCGNLFTRGYNNIATNLATDTASKNPDNAKISMAAAALIASFTAEHHIVAILLKNVLRLQPGNVQVKIYLADALMGAGAIAEGCDLFSELIAEYPDRRANLCEHVSKQLLDIGYPLEAYQLLSAWLESEESGKGSVPLLNNMACALVRLERSIDAIPWYEKALKIAPDNQMIYLGHAIALLKVFRYEEGFARYIQRPPITGSKKWWFMSLPRLGHDDVKGKKIILYQEQGFGDSLHFIRFVPKLVQSGSYITIAVPKPMIRIYELSFASLPEVDVQELSLPNAPINTFPKDTGYSFSAPIPDLPYITNIRSQDDLRHQTFPYLKAAVEDVTKFAELLPPKRPRIGIVWAGERRFSSDDVATDKRRSTTLEEMGQAIGPINATLVNLQFGQPREELKSWTGQEIFDPMEHVQDMADTAAILENIDLLISVDTSPVHLAGGLNRPVWMISRRDACWRWGDHGEKSPWYPKLRIFRAKEKSFVPIMKELGQELRTWIKDWQAP